MSTPKGHSVIPCHGHEVDKMQLWISLKKQFIFLLRRTELFVEQEEAYHRSSHTSFAGEQRYIPFVNIEHIGFQPFGYANFY